MDQPTFRELPDEESLEVLARNHVGRMAFTFRDRVDIEPVHYVLEGDWIFGRTAPGSKTSTLAQHPWVAFEVDEVDGLFDWRSVVVRGTVIFLDPAGGDLEASEWERAVNALRRLIPETLRMDDPTPFRTIVFGMKIDELTGRAAAGR
jgi:uncharacterized protein